jgi:hypothetical protein
MQLRLARTHAQCSPAPAHDYTWTEGGGREGGVHARARVQRWGGIQSE